MNRDLQSLVFRLNQAVARIERATRATHEDLAKLKADKVELTQKSWTQGKKAKVLAETSGAFEALSAENAALKETLRAARDHAARLRQMARALKEGLEP